MPNVELASAYISLVPSAKGISSAIESEMGAPLTAAGKKAGEDTGGAFSDGFKRHAKQAALAVAVGVVALSKVAIDAASNMNESLGKVGVVFGDNADEVTEWGKTAAKSFGLSNQKALEAAGTYGNLFQAFGLGRKEATGMSTDLVGLAADLASFNNTSVDDALVALRSGLSGETEPLKKFGVAINDSRLKQEALKLGLIKTTKDALTPAVKAQASYALILHDTALAQGDFERTSGGLANQQRILTAQTEDLKVALGEKLLPAKLAVVKFLNEKGLPAFQAFGEKVLDVYNNVKTLAASTVGQWLKDIKQGFDDARQAFDEFNKTGEWEAHGTFEKLGVAAALVTDAMKQAWTDLKTGFGDFNTADGWDGASTFEKIGIVSHRVLDAIGTAWTTTRDAVVAVFSDISQGVIAMGVAFHDGSDDVTSSGLEGKIEGIGVVARNLFDYLAANKNTLEPIVASMGAFALTIIAVQKATAAISIVKTAFTALAPAVGGALAPLLANPVALIIAGIVALGVAAYMLYTRFEPFREVVDAIGRTIRDVALVVWAALQRAFEVTAGFVTDTLIPTVTGIYSAIVGALTPLAHWFNENVVSTVRAVVEAVTEWINRMIDAWKLIWTIVEPQLKLVKEGIEAAFAVIKGFFQAFVDVTMPILSLAWDVLTAPVIFVFDAIKLTIETTLGAIRGIFEIFKGILSGDFGKIWEGFKTLVSAPFDFIKGIIGSAFNVIWDLISGLPDRLNGIWRGVWSGLADIASGIWDGITGMFGGLLEFLRPVINFLISALNLIIDGVNLVIKGINDISPFTDISEIDHIAEWAAAKGPATPGHIGAGTKFAAGGVAPGGWALTGEHGAELVHLPRGARVYPADLTAAMLDGGSSGGVNIGTMVIDPRRERSVREELEALLWARAVAG